MEIPFRNGDSSHTTTPSTAAPTAEDLLARCTTLWNELEAFRDHLKERRREATVEISHYRGVVKSELKNLEKLSAREKERRAEEEAEAALRKEQNGHASDAYQDAEEEDPSIRPRHSVASSNLPFLEAVWNATKNSDGIAALQKRFYFGDIVEDTRVTGGSRSRKRRGVRNVVVRKGKALVDVVAKDGLEWMKVSLITNHRMLMDKAREGWGGDSSSESESDEEDGDDKSKDDDPDSGIPIVRMAEGLAEARKMIRIRSRHPVVRLLLPKIVEGQMEVIDAIIAKIRGLGISVECSNAPIVPRTLSEVLDRLITDPFSGLTKTLNIDCTILLALVSDFSHCAVSAEPWFHRALKRQVEIEDKENLLPNTLYPAICGRSLLCTGEAAKRMREIVDTIGTQGEKVRTALFMGDEPSKDEAMLREELQQWSKFKVPDDLILPVRVVEWVPETGHVPTVVQLVDQHLASINNSVFLYGWKAGITTVTSNRSVVKQIESICDKAAEGEQEWPLIWLCPTARSLVGKEKSRKE